MSAQLSLYADPQAEAAGAVAAVAASLPLSFAPAPAQGPAPDVVAVAGHTGWTQRAAGAIRGGARGVVVTSPVPEDAGQLTAQASESGATVVLDQRWAGNAVLAGPSANVQDVIADALRDAVLVDSVAVAAPGTDPLQLLTEQLSAVLHAGIELRNVRMVQRSANGYTVAATLPGGAPTALQGILTSSLPATASISVLTSAGRADIVLPEPAAAWPAEVRVVNAEGAMTLPTLYESAHRTSWSRAHSHITSGNPANDLGQFTAAMSLLTQLTD
ncbi:hypothetical protein [Arthrobacter sp. ISL-65]|uniref:hypothetical protein n=1 Tax=Arthrobacter sp. ISL-65 TaxID=2819112 RepID=UPI001BE8BEB0|nr:hypothetical protein [Arthrobacter sp. ISL-65]MBT2549245.1 hypothetical protein [Arthrobacter sp. ISL-65]